VYLLGITSSNIQPNGLLIQIGFIKLVSEESVSLQVIVPAALLHLIFQAKCQEGVYQWVSF